MLSTTYGGVQQSPRHHQRSPTIPFARTSRHKPRRYTICDLQPLRILLTSRCRWPLVLRFIKGAIHRAIVFPVVLHGLFAALVVYIDSYHKGNLGLPASIVCLQLHSHFSHEAIANSTDPKSFHCRRSHARSSSPSPLPSSTIYISPRFSATKPPTTASGTAATISR